MLGTVDEIDYDGDRVRKVVLRFPAPRDGDSAVVREVRACERIGQGSFGTVYRAICEDYPRLALKIATGKSTRLKQELEVLSRVCTKGHLLLPRFEFGALNKTADLIVVGMELCVPSTLHDLLLSTRITSEAEMLFMAYQAVQAVGCVHAAGCIHRDIKLQNFVFDLDGNLKLIDFGLACTSLSPPAGDVVAGTVSFMSPEMAHNALHKDRRVSVGVAADVWSLGIVLFSIFTQRNPYPSVEAPSQGTSPGAAPPQQQAEVSAQHRMNERLLRRVAAGDWQWPVGVTVSDDLKQLVNSILVTPPEQRPSVAQIAQNKLWNLRRRYPPAAVAAFLGVQDDFMLSHDEAHLMRAVEQRSAGVTASLHHSGAQSPDTSSSATTASPTAATATAGGAASTNTEALDGAEASHLPGTSTPPVRSSLKVVQRGEGGVDGAVAVQVYDIRASTRKRSRPIREISVVMAEETAKRQKAATRRRGVSRAVKSAPASHRSSPTPAVLDDDVEKITVEEPRRASSAGATLRYVPPSRTTAAMVLDDDEEDVVEVVRPLVMRSVSNRSANAARSHSQQSRKGTEKEEEVNVDSPETKEEASCGGAEGQTSSSNPAASSSTPPSILSKPSTSAVAAETITTTQDDDDEDENGKRAGSVELVETSDAEESPLRVGRSRQGSKKVASRTAATVGAASSTQRGRTGSSTRPRDTSLRQPSSSILHGMTHPLATATETAEEAAAAATTGVAATTISARADSSPPPPRQPPRLVSDADVKALVRAEVGTRRYLSANLLLEHAWLLASFRLTMEEDQERYNITWLAEEQAKSAAHPHRFNEMTRVTSSKYKYGFVCDLCDYEFLPYGRDKKSLHYFHCSCGRDLCPECFEEYRRQCTCSCCRIAHGNSKVLREHLQRTGGTQLYGGREGGAATAVTAATHVESHRTSHKRAVVVQDDDFVEESEDESDDGEERRKSRKGARGRTSSNKSKEKKTKKNPSGRISSGNSGRATHSGRASARAAQEEEADWSEEEEDAHVHLPRMSVAAMQQERRAPVTSTTTTAAASSSSKGARTRTRARADAASNSAPQRAENVEVRQRAVEQLPEGPWRPFARFKKDRQEEAARQPTSDERDALLNGDWIRHFYLFPNTAAAENGGGRAVHAEEPYAFVYHAQPGRTGAIFLTSDFPMHSAVFSMLERQFFVVDQVDTVEGADTTRATSLLRAKAQPDLKMAFQALQDVVAYDTNMMKQQRTPGTVSVYQAPRSAYSCNGEPFLYVRWFRFNEDRTLSAFLLSNGAVQVFVSNEYELRWFDENRKFLIRYNGVCEVVDDSTFTLAPAINHLLYDSFDA